MVQQNSFNCRCRESNFTTVKSTFSPSNFFLRLLVVMGLFFLGCGQSKHVPQTLDVVNGLDGSQWEQVSTAGFGDDANTAIVAMAEYCGRLYALVRNDNKGVTIPWNIAIKKSRAEIILLVNNDLIFYDGWLDPLVNCLLSDRRIAFISPRMIAKREHITLLEHQLGSTGTIKGGTGCCFGFWRKTIIGSPCPGLW